MNMIKVILALIVILSVVSCNRVKNKSKEIADQVIDKAESKIEHEVDKLFPTFDSGTPDTENNKKRFKDFLKVELTKDVKNIYCFDDAIGIDASYMFSFNCDSITVAKIIEVNSLRPDTNEQIIFGPQYEFDWWDEDRIEELQRYIWTNDDRYYKYFWYDRDNLKAYFFDFDI